MTKVKIKITGNAQIFTATLLNNSSAKAFKQLLPLTIKMVELNRNEKYADLQTSLPTNPSNPKTITIGDLMLYGSETLVLFYKTFSTSYSYTKLGQIDDVTDLASALGPSRCKNIYCLRLITRTHQHHSFSCNSTIAIWYSTPSQRSFLES